MINIFSKLSEMRLAKIGWLLFLSLSTLAAVCAHSNNIVINNNSILEITERIGGMASFRGDFLYLKIDQNGSVEVDCPKNPDLPLAVENIARIRTQLSKADLDMIKSNLEILNVASGRLEPDSKEKWSDVSVSTIITYLHHDKVSRQIVSNGNISNLIAFVGKTSPEFANILSDSQRIRTTICKNQ